MYSEGLADLRNRIFASRRFQRWASAVPGVRNIAQKRSAELFDLTAGFIYSQVLYACVELCLFEKLAQGAVSLEMLSQETEIPVDALRRLAQAAEALRLLEVRAGERLALGPQGAALLGNASVFEMIRHHRMLYEDLTDPIAMLQRRRGDTRLGAFWSYPADGHAENLAGDKTQPYSKLMASTQAFIADEVIAAHNFGSYTSILDVGGGAGAFLCAVAKNAPKAELTLFDLPTVAEQARKRFRESQLLHRARVVGGSFRTDSLPQGSDLVTLIRVLHDQDDSDAQALLRSVFESLPPKGRLLIAEPMSGTTGTIDAVDAYFSIYLWAMGRGTLRSPRKIKKMLLEAGFQRPELVRTRQPLLTQVMTAQKPSA